MSDEQNELTKRLNELPTDVQPERDLWPDIQARMKSNGVHDDRTVLSISSARGWGKARRHVPVVWAVAASAAFASIVGGSVWVSMRGAAVDAGANPGLATGPVSSDYDPYAFASEGLAEYEAAAADLQAVINAGREMLDPETLEVLEQSLTTIDAAISEARAALDADPGHEGLRRMLQENHRRKLGLLRQAAVAVQSNT